VPRSGVSRRDGKEIANFSLNPEDERKALCGLLWPGRQTAAFLAVVEGGSPGTVPHTGKSPAVNSVYVLSGHRDRLTTLAFSPTENAGIRRLTTT